MSQALGQWETPYSQAMEAEQRRARALFAAGVWIEHRHQRSPESLAASRAELVKAPQQPLAKAIRYALSLRWLA